MVLPLNVKVPFNTSGVINALNYERLQMGSNELVPWAMWKCGLGEFAPPVLFPETPVTLNGLPASFLPGGAGQLVGPPIRSHWFPPNFAWVGSGASVDFK